MWKSALEDLEEALASMPPPPPAKRLITDSDEVATAAEALGVRTVRSGLTGGNSFIIDDPDPLYSPGAISPYPVRTKITVLAADDPTKFNIGWTVKESVGIGVHNPRGARPDQILLERPATNGSGTLRTVWNGDRARLKISWPDPLRMRDPSEMQIGEFEEDGFKEHELHQDARARGISSWDPVLDAPFIRDSMDLIAAAEVMES